MTTLWPLLLCTMIGAQAQERILDDFEQPLAWKAVVSDGVTATVSSAPGVRGQGMRFDVDFGSAAGYASAKRALPLDFDGDYAISFWMRADAPLNNFEMKLVDASGDNVWWVNRPNFAISREWQKVTFKKRHIDFAWGPLKDRTLRRTEQMELVVSAGRDGGRGSVWIDDLRMRAIAPAGAPPEPVVSTTPGAVTVDYGVPREFGGLVLHWADGLHAARYDVAFSNDGGTWRTVRKVVDGTGGADPLLLGESEARYVRVAMPGAAGPGYRLDRIELKDLAYGASANSFFQALAKEAPRGHYPRGMSGQQNYWTVLGVDGGRETGLISEDGAIEAARAGFTIEPFIIDDGKLVTWADVTTSQSLREGYLPIPSATWTAPRWRLRTSAFAQGTPAASQLIARYDLANPTAAPLKVRLVLALRPLQVNPPMQFLNTAPGVSPIRTLAWNGDSFAVDGATRVWSLAAPDHAGVSSFDHGAIPARLAGDGWSALRRVDDQAGFASGALAYDVTLAPGATAVFGLALPLDGPAQAPQLGGASPAQWLTRMQDDVAGQWRARLNRVLLTVPPSAQPLVDTLRSSLAHILMTRDGAALMPGTRSYARSWIRDGAMMSEAMLRLGDYTDARDYVNWYAPHQFANGKIPCCVDRRGADPVPENDSQGEFIFLVAQVWRYTHDRELVTRLWPRVKAAAAYMERQRQSERTAANLTPERRMLYGLLPASISHEGYSAKPMHSNWDNFWGLRGYRDAAMLATVVNQPADAASLSAQADQFERELLASLRLSASTHRIGYLAGAAELGDFDPTSTTIALSPGGLQQRLPQDLLHGTFERYWLEAVARRDGRRAWNDYTPYELRNVAAFVRLGWRERAHELLDVFMRDRRPAAWNQWAEVVGRDAREPRFVGDMPHGWIASDFIRSALDLFAYERESDQSLIVADGIPAAWLDGTGVAVQSLPTGYGWLDYTIRSDARGITMGIGGKIKRPPGGVRLRAHDARWSGARTTINGKAAHWRGGELRIGTLPATIFIARDHTKGKP
ncbi:coagulation factor 5/8 type domain-containing protein [Massilia sp. CCM 8733]|uniref:Coagulation factor 5/8 type domain-containing protein n=1 Tax=Massilia mucilaginosa TaxID=2609282 RepID=A0ABX0NTE8_9BURK|nr:discoidin domain-containing protein [Massilia mucilaginosa]NHZ90028.1 coagulation factor 5/8 type domain-containing protein [Massilia mucilaginosa]